MAGEGVDGPRRKRVVSPTPSSSGCSSLGTGRRGGSRRSSPATPPGAGQRCSCEASSSSTTGGRTGSAVRDRPRPVRGVPQRRAGRRRRAHARVHRVPRRAPGPDLRRRRSAATRAQRRWRDPVRRLVPRPGGAAARPRPVGPRAGLPGPGARRLRGRHERGRGTGERWRSARSHIDAADLIAGQSVDFRRRPEGWSDPGFDDGRLGPVAVVDHGTRTWWPRRRRPSARWRVTAAAVRRVTSGQVFDLGQNINGWVRLREPRAGGDGDHADPRRGGRRGRRRHH